MGRYPRHVAHRVGDSVFEDDRDLYDDKPCADTVLHNGEQRAQPDGMELFQRPCGTWVPGISDDDMYRHVCGARSDDHDVGRYDRFRVGGTWIYDPSVLLAHEDFGTVKEHI